MKVHTTNYIDTFIEVADDCPTDISEMPKLKEEINNYHQQKISYSCGRFRKYM
jgi:hypothetical protein